MSQIQSDIKALTETIVDAPHKLNLRPTLTITLVRDFSHPWNEVESALDQFYAEATVH